MDRPVVLKWTAGGLGVAGLMAVYLALIDGGASRDSRKLQGAPAVTSSAKLVVAHSKKVTQLPFAFAEIRDADLGKVGRDPLEGWLSEITNEEDDVAREKAIDAFIGGLDSTTLPAAISFFAEHESNGWASEMAGRLIRRLAETDPALAAREVEKFPESAVREKAMQDVAVVWGNQNADEAAKWVRSWPEEEAREQGMIGVAYEAARKNPVSALTLAAERSPSAARNDLINHVAAQWAVTEPQAAGDWAKKIPDAALRARVAGTIATEWAEKDPLAAASMAVSQLPVGKLQDDTVVGIVERWGQVDPAGAQSWVQQFPNGSLRQTAMENLAKLRPEQAP